SREAAPAHCDPPKFGFRRPPWMTRPGLHARMPTAPCGANRPESPSPSAPRAECRPWRREAGRLQSLLGFSIDNRPLTFAHRAPIVALPGGAEAGLAVDQIADIGALTVIILPRVARRLKPRILRDRRVWTRHARLWRRLRVLAPRPPPT